MREQMIKKSEEKKREGEWNEWPKSRDGETHATHRTVQSKESPDSLTGPAIPFFECLFVCLTSHTQYASTRKEKGQQEHIFLRD